MIASSNHFLTVNTHKYEYSWWHKNDFQTTPCLLASTNINTQYKLHADIPSFDSSPPCYIDAFGSTVCVCLIPTHVTAGRATLLADRTSPFTRMIQICHGAVGIKVLFRLASRNVIVTCHLEGIYCYDFRWGYIIIGNVYLLGSCSDKLDMQLHEQYRATV